MRRDLTLALLWGTPVALAFGFLAAICSSLLSMVIAAFGAWYGRWVDGLIQRLVEINMVLPAFPIMLLIFNFYSKRIWVILGVTVLLSIFGGAVKTYRSVFLQLRESLYIESAKAYGASNMRVIFTVYDPSGGIRVDPSGGCADPRLCVSGNNSGVSQYVRSLPANLGEAAA